MSDDLSPLPPQRPEDLFDRLTTAASGPQAADDLGGFQRVAKIGRGGMGEVWKAWDPVGKRFVAIKLVPSDVQHAEEEMARVQETFARIHALSHQSICPVYLLGRDPRYGYFLVMKYIEGQTLSAWRRSYVARHGDLPVKEVVRVLAPVADALDYAHARHVIHRDIKPQNILVVGDAEEVVLVDLGLAAQIQTSLGRVSQVRIDTSGTRPYMAPEQWRAGRLDAGTDQYALGVVAYELLAGRLPFESADAEVLRLCVLNEPAPEVPGQPAHVDRAIGRALAKRREERFPSCRAFIEALGAPPPAEGGGARAPAVQAVTPPALPMNPGPSIPVASPVSPAAPGPGPFRPTGPSPFRDPRAPVQPVPTGRPAVGPPSERLAPSRWRGLEMLLVIQVLAALLAFGASIVEVQTIAVTGPILAVAGVGVLVLGVGRSSAIGAVTGASAVAVCVLLFLAILVGNLQPYEVTEAIPVIAGWYSLGLCIPLLLVTLAKLRRQRGLPPIRPPTDRRWGLEAALVVQLLVVLSAIGFSKFVVARIEIHAIACHAVILGLVGASVMALGIRRSTLLGALTGASAIAACILYFALGGLGPEDVPVAVPILGGGYYLGLCLPLTLATLSRLRD